MNDRLSQLSPAQQFILSLVGAMGVSVGLYGYGLIAGYGLQYEYLLWNLFLAALPLVFAIRLVRVLHYKRWSDWEPLGWTLAWLLFLPNSFYLITDLIHLREVGSDAILYAAVVFTSFIYLGVVLGFSSLILVHHELRRRLLPLAARLWVAGVLLACSFAIYLGRDLRWNTWDVIFKPAGLLFDISDRLLQPAGYPMMFVTVISFFVLLSSLYAVLWSGAKLLRRR